MSKEKSKVESNPFAQFNALQGKIIPPDETLEEEIVTGEENVIKDTDEDTEAARLAEGTKLIEENIKKAEALKKGNKTEVVETIAENENEEQVEEEIAPLKGYANELYNKGVIDFDAADPDFVESEEGLEKLISKTVENRINKWADSLPQEYHDFLDYVKQGGNPKDFLDIYYGNTSWEDFKVEDSTEAQKTAIRESFILAGENPEDVEEMISDWEAKEDGTLEKRAKSALSKLQKHEATEKANLLKQQAEQAEKQKKANIDFMDNFKKDLYSKEDVMGFKLTPKIKDKLWEYMTVTDKKTGKTAYQSAVEQNKDSSILFALQAMQGFNLTTLEKQVNNKVTGNLAKLLKNVPEQKERISGGRTQEHVDTNPFDIFRAAKS